MTNQTAFPEPGDQVAQTHLVLVCCLLAVLTFAPRSIIGVYQQPLLNAFNPGTDPTTRWQSVQAIVWAIGAPVAGLLSDRFGAMRIAALGSALCAIGLSTLAWSTSAEVVDISGGLIVGFGISGSSFVALSHCLGRQRNRLPMSLGLVTAAAGFGIFLFTPLAFALVGAIGWRGSIFTFAGLSFGGAILATVNPSQKSVPTAMLDTTRADRNRTRSAALLLVTFLAGFEFAFITQRVQKYAFETYISANVGSLVLALICIASVIGALAAGHVIKRRLPGPVMASIAALRLVAILGLVLVPTSPASTFILAGVVGLIWLLHWPPTLLLASDLAEDRRFGISLGFCVSAYQIGGVTGGFAHAGVGTSIWVWSVLAALVAVNVLLCAKVAKP